MIQIYFIFSSIKVIIQEHEFLFVYGKIWAFNKKFLYRTVKNSIINYILWLRKNMRKDYLKIIVEDYYIAILGKMIILFSSKYNFFINCLGEIDK